MTRAIAALREIMLDHDGTAPRRRIEACEHLLEYEAPPEIVDEAKAVLTAISETPEIQVDMRLDALKLLRKAEARKIVPPKATTREVNVELCRTLEILKRKAALYDAGIFPPPRGYDDDLTGPDFVPVPTDEAVPEDVGEALAEARRRHLRKVRGEG